MNNIKSKIARNLSNIKGWKTNRKIVVIKSDDWGSTRMPDKKTYNKLQNSRILNSLSLYDRLDSLEHREDFQALLGIGSEFKNSRYNPLILL